MENCFLNIKLKGTVFLVGDRHGDPLKGRQLKADVQAGWNRRLTDNKVTSHPSLFSTPRSNGTKSGIHQTGWTGRG
jgi:hypothetical protein